MLTGIGHPRTPKGGKSHDFHFRRGSVPRPALFASQDHGGGHGPSPTNASTVGAASPDLPHLRPLTTGEVTDHPPTNASTVGAASPNLPHLRPHVTDRGRLYQR